MQNAQAEVRVRPSPVSRIQWMLSQYASACRGFLAFVHVVLNLMVILRYRILVFCGASDKNNIACAFSVNVVLTALRADNGGVCFGVSVAVLVLWYVLSFGYYYCPIVLLAAAFMSVKDNPDWVFLRQVVLIT